MEEVIKQYTNGEVTIIWKPATCVHSTICWKHATGLPQVFNPMVRPWIKPEAATTEAIIEQVKKCPSGALTYFMNNEVEKIADVQTESIVEAMPNGPLLVYGNILIKDKDGNEVKRNKVTAFCRYGASGNKPYCDGSHQKIGFVGKVKRLQLKEPFYL